MNLLSTVLISIFLLFGCNRYAQEMQELENEKASAAMAKAESQPKMAKNIILMIGDGMGLAQISAGTYAYGNQSVLEEFKVIGLHKSYASDNLVTDSAAGATAFACGIKSYNGSIGVGPDSLSRKTILEEAEERGLSTGLVASSTIVHATPASFISHNKSRQNYEAIALDFLDTDIDFFVGGGLKYFNRRESDERNLIAEFEQNGYVIQDYFNDDFSTVVDDPTSKFGFLTSDADPLPVAQGRDYLPRASSMAINHLSKHDTSGYFLMIEGSQIDWGGHANNIDYVLTEFKEFDACIADVLAYAKADGNTLVIVTADHETGGLAIQPESSFGNIVAAFTTTSHTACMIPVFAYGPGSENFAGIYENTAIYNKMRQAFGWEVIKK